MKTNLNCEMVERLKANEKPYGMLSGEEKKFLTEHLGEVEVFNNSGWCYFDRWSRTDFGTSYRLRPDFELPPEEKARWLFDTKTHLIYEVTRDDDLGVCMDNKIEVQEGDLPYLKKPEGDWEFRKMGMDDTCGYILYVNGTECGAIVGREWGERVGGLSGYRWCKPEKEIKHGEKQMSRHIDALPILIKFIKKMAYHKLKTIREDARNTLDDWDKARI